MTDTKPQAPTKPTKQLAWWAFLMPRGDRVTGYKRPHYDTYKDLAEALKRKVKKNPERYPCWICRNPIDVSLPWKHPMSYTYDHNDPMATGGDARGDGRPAHRSCNSRRGDGSNTIERVTATNVSIDWLAGPIR